MKLNVRPMQRSITSLIGLSISAALLSFSTVGVAGNSNGTITEITEYEDVEEFAPPPAGQANPDFVAINEFGPFLVIADDLVEMRGTVDETTPAAFRRLIAAYPGIRTIRMIDCPGSLDDDANLALSRMVRRAGINTHVPANGSIRSGAVEFFLAGVKRTIEPGAQFGVHSWEDEDGREANEYPASDPVHSAYINFYVDMGLNRDSARAFYEFTNRAAPASGVYYMKPPELARFHILN